MLLVYIWLPGSIYIFRAFASLFQLSLDDNPTTLTKSVTHLTSCRCSTTLTIISGILSSSFVDLLSPLLQTPRIHFKMRGLGSIQKKFSGWRAPKRNQVANGNNKSDWRDLYIIRRLTNSSPLRKLKSIFQKKSQSSNATSVEYQQLPSPSDAASSSPHTSDSTDSLGSIRFEAIMPEHLPTLASLSPTKSLNAARAPS